MRQIYAISSGEYSDYRVLGVCEDESTADAWAAAIKGDEDSWGYRDARVETLVFIEAGEKPCKETQFTQSIELSDDGGIERGEIRAHADFSLCSLYGPPPLRPVVRYVRAPCHKGKGGRLDVRAATAEAVAKVVSEKIAMWKAGAWGGPAHQEINEEVGA